MFYWSQRSMQKKQEEEDLAKQLHKKTNKKKKDKKRGPRLSGELWSIKKRHYETEFVGAIPFLLRSEVRPRNCKYCVYTRKSGAYENVEYRWRMLGKKCIWECVCMNFNVYMSADLCKYEQDSLKYIRPIPWRFWHCWNAGVVQDCVDSFLASHIIYHEEYSSISSSAFITDSTCCQFVYIETLIYW